MANAFIVIITFFWGMYFDIFSKASAFWVTFWTIFEKWSSNVNLWSIKLPNIFSYFANTELIPYNINIQDIIRRYSKKKISAISFQIVILKSCKICRDVFPKFTQHKVHIWFTSIKDSVVCVINDVRFVIAKKKIAHDWLILDEHL